jgi:hypothetical protein
VRAVRRVETAAPGFIVSRFNSGATTYRNALGRVLILTDKVSDPQGRCVR